MPFNKHRYRGRLPLFLVFGIAKAFVLGGLVMILWNFILPEVTGLRTLSYWQGVGLWLFCRILFGGLGHVNISGRHASHWKGSAWKDKWMQMTPEEREKFQQEWRNRWKRKE